MPWRVLITAQAMARSGQAAITRLREAGHELIFPIQPSLPTPEELGVLLQGVDAVIAGVERYDDSLFDLPGAKDLKLISRWGVGYDSIDIPAATRAGIAVAYTPGLLNETVADYAFSLLCSVARRVYTGHLEMAQGKWVPSWGHNIHDKTLGLVGCGRIGLAVARRASGFNMKVLAFDPRPSEEAAKLGVQFVGFETLLEQSDYVSVHAALSPQTRGLVGEAQLRRMKPSAYLINTSRGAILDEVALAKVLREGVIAGAALDTFQVEPLPKDHVFHGVPNLLLTPHQASFTRETGALVSEAAGDAVLNAAMGRRPRWLVDESVLASTALRFPVSSAAPSIA